MKLVLIAYNEALDSEIDQLLKNEGVEGFTKWTKAYGKGKSSDPHLGSHVWPKANNVMAIFAEEDTTEKIMDGIRAMRKRLSREGVKAFVVPCEEVT